MLASQEITALKQSAAMAPLSPEQTRTLLDTAEALVRERAEIRALLAELPESFGAVREQLNRLARIVG